MHYPLGHLTLLEEVVVDLQQLQATFFLHLLFSFDFADVVFFCHPVFTLNQALVSQMTPTALALAISWLSSKWLLLFVCGTGCCASSELLVSKIRQFSNTGFSVSKSCNSGPLAREARPRSTMGK